MKIVTEGSVRVDLVGGTLDLEPIALILKDVVTINMATGLKAKVEFEITGQNKLVINSTDYQKQYEYTAADFTDENFYKDGAISSHFFKEMLFVILICKSFDLSTGFKISLSSGAPAGSGLGGSSAMGVTLAQAILEYKKIKMNRAEIVQHVRKMEELILDRGVAGYQDYYPALYGGILAIRPGVDQHGIEQLYAQELATFLEKNLVLVYSGLSRNSGINNWEVFKNFFDFKNSEGINNSRAGLIKIAEVAKAAYECLKQKNYQNLLALITEEGKIREQLFPGIVTQEMKAIRDEAQEHIPSFQGIKICGAGGGGCFLMVGVNAPDVSPLVEKHKMKILPLTISIPVKTEAGIP